MERGSRKRSSSAGSEKVERVGNRHEKMEGYCWTGQRWRELVTDRRKWKDIVRQGKDGVSWLQIRKNGRILFDRAKMERVGDR
jgi:hypothetical protein